MDKRIVFADGRVAKIKLDFPGKYTHLGVTEASYNGMITTFDVIIGVDMTGGLIAVPREEEK